MGVRLYASVVVKHTTCLVIKHKLEYSCLEFKAVMVLPTITQNYGNYPYGNYVG